MIELAAVAWTYLTISCTWSTCNDIRVDLPPELGRDKCEKMIERARVIPELPKDGSRWVVITCMPKPEEAAESE